MYRRQPKLLFKLHTNLCEWGVAIRPVVRVVNISQCSSSCDERIHADHYGTWRHTAKCDDQHTIHYHLKKREREREGGREREREREREMNTCLNLCTHIKLTAMRAAFLDS